MAGSMRFWSRAWRYRLRGDPAEIAAMRKRLAPGDVALDVGAHKGGYLYWMRRAVGSRGRVIAFEPQVLLARRLEEERSGRGWTNVVVENLGVSSAPATLDLIVPTESGDTSPGATFESAKRVEPHRVQSIPVVTIDDYARRAGLPRLDFLKVDVEGHELEVLRGAIETIERFSPTILLECECRHLGGSTPDDVFALLLERGYRGWYFGPGGLAPIESFDPEVHQPRVGDRFWEARGYVNNFLFERPAGVNDRG